MTSAGTRHNMSRRQQIDAVLGGLPPYSRRVIGLFGSSLIAYWKLDETTGTVAADSSGNGRTGAYSGVDLASVAWSGGGMAPLFDGTNVDIVNIYSASLAAAFNIDEGGVFVWGMVQSAGVWTDGTERYLMCLAVDASTYIYIRRTTTNAQLNCIYRSGGANHTVNIASGSPTGWFLIGVTWSQVADEVRIYYNGAQSGSTVTPVAQWVGALGSTRTLLGDRIATGAGRWSGYVAHCGVLNRPFTLTEFQKLYNWGV